MVGPLAVDWPRPFCCNRGSIRPAPRATVGPKGACQMVPRLRSSAIVLAVIALLAGVLLFVYGRWSAPAQAATAAAAAGEVDKALAAYANLGARYKRFP